MSLLLRAAGPVLLLAILASCTPEGTPTSSPTLVLEGTPFPLATTPAPEVKPTESQAHDEGGTVFGLPRSQTLVMAEDEPVTLDPALSLEASSQQFVSQIFSGLVRLDDGLRVAPDLAERWDVLDGGTRYIFHLRPAARFHNGRAVTAEDVLFSLERAADPATGSSTAATYLGDIVGVPARLKGESQRISGLRALDKATVEIRIDGPKAYFPAKLTSSVASVVDRENVATGPQWYRKPNGTGPFRLKQWEPESRLVLERHQDFYREAPRAHYVLFRFLAGIPISMYERGEIDVAYVGTGSLERILAPQSALRKELRVYPELTIRYVGFNAAVPPFHDPQVRKAFAAAVDVDKLVEVVHEGGYKIAKGFLPPGMPAYVPATPDVTSDTDEGRKWLSQSSYGAAEKLPPVVYTVPGLGEIGGAEAALVEMWRAKLGVEVSVRQIPPEVYYYRLKEEVGNLFDFGWAADYPDPENFLDALFHTGAANNIGSYGNLQIDALLEAARVEQNLERRLGMYRRVQEMLVKDAAAIPLWYPTTYVLVKPYVREFSVTPLGRLALERAYLDLK